MPYVRLSTVKVGSAPLRVGSSLAIGSRQQQLRATAAVPCARQTTRLARPTFPRRGRDRSVKPSRIAARRHGARRRAGAEDTLNAAGGCDRVSTDGA